MESNSNIVSKNILWTVHCFLKGRVVFGGNQDFLQKYFITITIGLKMFQIKNYFAYFRKWRIKGNYLTEVVVVFKAVLLAPSTYVDPCWMLKTFLSKSQISPPKKAKPRVSLTAPNRNHFARVSLKVLDKFFGCNPKAKKLIRESIAQNLKRVSMTKSFLALAMAFNLLLSNLT